QNGTDCTESGLSGHQVLPFMLTGTVGGECPVNPDDIGRQATGPSVDRFIGKELRKRHNLRFDSLVIKATERTHTSFNDGYLSFDGPPIGGLPNAPSQIVSPVALYDELFGDGNMTAAELANLRLRRKSILDLVGSDLERFRKNLGKEDRARIEQHLTSIRSVEQQLEVENLCGGVNLEELGLSRTTNYLNPNGNPHMHKAMRAQTELTVLGLACDATRVASLLWPESTGTFTVFHWLGSDFIVPGDPEVFADQGNNKGLLSHHELAHLEAGKEEYQPLVNRACQWYMEEFAYLIQRLAETDDVDGKRMLDNSAALFANMQRTGAGHEVFDLPWVLAGSCGGYFETGRFLPWPSGTANQGAPQNGVLAALCKAMGVPVDHFGAADYGGEMTVLKG
ncbi:MAG: DUF1552 domain-containing protein, partial [Myxococcales bacterium]|nr:DUF1552 domain-containing protein [Myxococcales bacterium]